MRHRAKQAVNLLTKAALASALIWYLIHVGALDLNAIALLATPSIVCAILALQLVMLALNNWRWMILLRAQGFPASVKSTFPLSLIGLFFNFAMPGGVGGDVIKGYYLLKEHPERRIAAALSIFMDRMSGFFIMLATAMAALVANWPAVAENRNFQAVGGTVALLLLGFIVFYAISLTSFVQGSALAQAVFDRLPGGRALRRIYEGLHSYRSRPGALAASFGVSVLSQLALVGANALVGAALGESIPLACYFFVVPVGTVVMTLPISVAGIGVGQAAFFFLYKMYLGRETQLGPTAVTALQLASFAWGLVGAVIYLRRKDPSAHADQTKSIYT